MGPLSDEFTAAVADMVAVQAGFSYALCQEPGFIPFDVLLEKAVENTRRAKDASTLKNVSASEISRCH
jgi:hypothetical protein